MKNYLANYKYFNHSSKNEVLSKDDKPVKVYTENGVVYMSQRDVNKFCFKVYVTESDIKSLKSDIQKIVSKENNFYVFYVFAIYLTFNKRLGVKISIANDFHVLLSDSAFEDESLASSITRCEMDSDYWENDFNVPLGDIKNDLRMGLKSLSYNISNGKKYRFGVEIETSKGYLMKRFQKDLNLKSMSDGSISGKEYVTGVLVGDSGFLHLKDICMYMKDFTDCGVNSACGLHVHLSGMEYNKSNVVSLYMLGYMIQNELYDITPGRKTNNYCKPLSSDIRSKMLSCGHKNYSDFVDCAYEHIVCSLSYKLPSSLNNKYKAHPDGRYTSTRYSWLNMVPSLWLRKPHNTSPSQSKNWRNDLFAGKTVEFRQHEGTLNYEEMKNWIRVCMCIMAYAENNKTLIYDKFRNSEEIDLNTIVTKEMPKKANILINYIKKKKNGEQVKSNYKLNKIKECAL